MNSYILNLNKYLNNAQLTYLVFRVIVRFKVKIFWLVLLGVSILLAYKLFYHNSIGDFSIRSYTYTNNDLRNEVSFISFNSTETQTPKKTHQRILGDYDATLINLGE